MGEQMIAPNPFDTIWNSWSLTEFLNFGIDMLAVIGMGIGLIGMIIIIRLLWEIKNKL